MKVALLLLSFHVFVSGCKSTTLGANESQTKDNVDPVKLADMMQNILSITKRNDGKFIVKRKGRGDQSISIEVHTSDEVEAYPPRVCATRNSSIGSECKDANEGIDAVACVKANSSLIASRHKQS